MPNSAPFSVAEGTTLDTQLAMNCRSVVVDNYTVSWMWIPATGRSVPPLTYGWIANCVATTQQALVKWQTPYGTPTYPQGKGTADVLFTDALLPPSNGTPVTTPTAGTPIVLVTFPTPAGVITRPRVQVPAGMQAIAVFSAQNPTGFFTVVGAESGTIYYDNVATKSSIAAGAGAIYDCHPVPLDPEDTGLSITITANNGNVDFVAFPQIPGPEDIQAFITSSVASPVFASISFPLTAPRSTPSYVNVLPYPIFNMNLLTGPFTAGTGRSLIAAPGVGNNVVLRRLKISYSAVPTLAGGIFIGTVSGGSSLGVMGVIVPAAANPLPPADDFVWDGAGYAIGDNLPVFVTVVTATGVALDVTVWYSIVVTIDWPTS